MKDITITLFHGTAGWFAALLLCAGAAGVFFTARDWLADRFTLAWSPLRVRRRWDHRAQALTDDGREVTILYVVRDSDSGDMASVQSYDEDEQELWPPEWVSLADLSPVPATAEEAA